MKASIFTIPILCVLLLTPLVFFQGDTSTIPAWLTKIYWGIPGSVLFTTAGFIATVLLTWYVGMANTDHLGEDE